MNATYEEKNKRFEDALAVKEPDRVPLIPFVQTYAVSHAGYTMAQAMYNINAGLDAYKSYHLEYDPDVFYGIDSMFFGMGPAFDKLGLKFLQWAGQDGSVCTENSIHQFVEKEYLKEDEYHKILSDKSGWIISEYLPRNFDVFKPFSKLDFSGMTGYACFPTMLQFMNPNIADTFSALGEIGQTLSTCFQAYENYNEEMINLGFPQLVSATTTVAFDVLSDCLRGTLGSMMDVLEQPENVKEAIEKFYPGTLHGALQQAKDSKGKVILIPLHKGLEGFLGNQQFEEFYWPTMKRLTLDLISHGYTPYLYTEGKYDARLNFLQELPRGKCMLHFEDCDMKQAKKILGGHICLTGGFDNQILVSGTVSQVKDTVKKTLDICADGGGYMFNINTTLDDGAKPENVEAMFETVKTYGKYN